ncbi:MAG: DUF599 family protein [Rhodospirillaceae bacterium]|nr:DUF599 family protein [Rhodospirillaceae bacterium]MYB12965.1 DUF599 family protein [Rhodospirillaceae bacterium]MYI49435.1 DUF599 family protein [Rhodospirillaceae bacterium]
MPSFPTPLDIAAILWFLCLWIGYNLIADSERLKTKSVFGTMQEHRNRWMKQMLNRDLRMLDALILNHLQSGVGLFASTSILAVGGLVASLGATDKAIAVLSALPFIGETTLLEWEVKVLLLILVFIYAFFKFVWSYRLYGFCAILIGAVPGSTNVDAEAERAAQQVAQIGNLAGLHQNRGLRAFYFALAALAWFLHPAALMIATAWVVIVLYRRDFRSRSLRIAGGVG